MTKKISKQQLQKLINDSQPKQIQATEIATLADTSDRKRSLKDFISVAESLIRSNTKLSLILIEEK